MSIKRSRSLIAVGLICSSLTSVSAFAETKKSEMPLPPPGPFTPAVNPAISDNANSGVADNPKNIESAPAGSFAPLNFDPEKPAEDAKAQSSEPKPEIKIEGKDENGEQKPVFAPADTAKIPVDEAPEKSAVPVADDTVAKPAEGGAEKAAPIIEAEKPVEAVKGKQPVVNPAGDDKEEAPKYAPAGTAEVPEEKAPPAIVSSDEKAPDVAPGKPETLPAYAPADTAKIPVPEIKKDPVVPKLGDAARTPDYAPAGTGNAQPPSNFAPAYGFQLPQYGQQQYQNPQYRPRQYQPQRQPQGYGYAPQYYPPQRGYWPQPYQRQMPPPPRGYQQQPQWQSQGPPQWQQRWPGQRPGYGFPNPYNWNPYGQQQGWQQWQQRPQARQPQQRQPHMGQPQQNVPQNNSSTGN